MPSQHAVLLSGSGAGEDGLLAWAECTGRRRATGPARGRLRFAFYGRVSTEDYQDPVTSRGRQRDQADALVRDRVMLAIRDEHGIMPVSSAERAHTPGPLYPGT